ncbi:MAG: AAA family ATPase [Nitrospira sp.]|nr:AAA family ATPase [Nitrospira sp.]
MDNIGVDAATQKYIPPLQGLRPDVLYVGPPGSVTHEVLPSGTRTAVDPANPRLPISVIDLKNITEANASYSAEVCLYAFFLSNWLARQDEEIAKKFFVADTVYLWRHLEMPEFTHIMSSKAGGDELKRIEALRKDLQDGLVHYLVYMPSVRKFLAQDVPRVVELGDKKGWAAVDYHVNPRCSSCDWLGNKKWLTTVDKKTFEANPAHYCFQNAEVSDHLSKIPTLSKGAAKVLDDAGYSEVATLVDVPSTASPLKKHVFLKKDRYLLGSRAQALTTNSIAVDCSTKVGGLAKYWNVEFDIVVNFDAGSGFLTGIALRGIISAPYGQSLSAPSEPPTTLSLLGEEAFVVPKDNLAAEWAALQSFIDTMADWIERSEKKYQGAGWGPVHTQICIWEGRQYEELCNAFGRHLFKILSVTGKTQRALAWIFPADELMEREEEVCPSIVCIRDVVNSCILSPQRFAITLLGTAEQYHYDSLKPMKIDSYYAEPLGNAIPRERIYEIWKSPTGTVRLFGKDVTITDAIKQYGEVLIKHAYALGSVTARLRSDLKASLSGNAPALKTSVPHGLTGVSYDSKLWGQWSIVSAATAGTNYKMNLVTRPEWLEASYKAVLLPALTKSHGANKYTFEVAEESTEAKLEEGDAYCVVGVVGYPGFPSITPKKLGVGDDLMKGFFFPLHMIIAARIEKFERAGRSITIVFRPRRSAFQNIFDALMAANVIGIGTQQIYLIEGAPYDNSKIVVEILKQIGNPAIATPSKEALQAMGKAAPKKILKGTDPDSPVARVLWDAKNLANQAYRSNADAKAIADFAKTANETELNQSQVDAVENVAARSLSIVWGPPGTGKTNTLTAFLHAVIRECKQKRILITGPNYRTVEELAERLAKNLGADTTSQCSFFWVYSRGRDPKPTPAVGGHLDLRSIRLEAGTEEVDHMRTQAADSNRTVVVATTAHMVDQVVQCVGGTWKKMDEVFDLVVLDESSQMPVDLAIRPLCGLKFGGQIVIAGDHLQMPPIQALEPPAGAEYLVSSIQTYLIERFSVPRQELLVNYRSNTDFVEYAKTLGYPQNLVAHSPNRQLLVLNPIAATVAALPAHLPKSDAYEDLLDPGKRVSSLIHDDPVSSQANATEAGLVGALALCLRQAMAKELDDGSGAVGTPLDDDFFFEKALGIVTPHKAQKALVVRELFKVFPKANPTKVYESVDTVERFQGGERQTIIVSFGVGDTDVIEGEEAFLLQMERTNVAVSRAMAKCIVIMPESLAYHLPGDQKAAEASIAIKSYIEEFCHKRRSASIQFNGETRQAEIRWR